MVQFISGDASGYNKNVSLTDIQATARTPSWPSTRTASCRNIIPGQPSNTWVGNLTKIRID